MTSTKPANEVLKTEVLGRVKTPRARQEAVLDEFERSGASGQEFEGQRLFLPSAKVSEMETFSRFITPWTRLSVNLQQNSLAFAGTVRV